MAANSSVAAAAACNIFLSSELVYSTSGQTVCNLMGSIGWNLLEIPSPRLESQTSWHNIFIPLFEDVVLRSSGFYLIGLGMKEKDIYFQAIPVHLSIFRSCQTKFNYLKSKDKANSTNKYDIYLGKKRSRTKQIH